MSGRLSISRVLPTRAAIEHPRLGAGGHVGGQRAEVGVGDHEVVEVDAVGGAQLGAGRAQRASTPYAASSLRRAQGRG